MKNIQSYHVGGGYWAHIEWNGNTGTDQHGRTWTNPQNPKCESCPWLSEYWGTVTKTILLISKQTAMKPQTQQPKEVKKPQPFEYLGKWFTPIVTNEKYNWNKLARKLWGGDETLKPLSCINDNGYRHEDFYKVAKAHGCGKVDVFEMDGEKVIPCNRLMYYGEPSWYGKPQPKEVLHTQPEYDITASAPIRFMNLHRASDLPGDEYAVNILDEENRLVAKAIFSPHFNYLQAEANAELIVKAVNELPNYKKWLKEEQDKAGEYCRVITQHENTIDTLRQSNKELKQALKEMIELAKEAKGLNGFGWDMINSAQEILNNTK